MRQIPSTGFAGFDEELQALFELDQAKAEETIRTADGDLSKIVAGISHDAIRAALALEDEDLVKHLSRAHPRQLTALFDEAREISRKLFGTILKDPEKRAQLEESVVQQGPSDEYYDSLNYFNNIRTYSEWQISDESVTPRLRVHFTGFREKVIFDTSFDWDDAINVAYRLTQQVREHVEHLNLLTPQAQKTVDLKNEFGDRIPKRISTIVKDLREIRDRFCELGFSRDDFDFE